MSYIVINMLNYFIDYSVLMKYIMLINLRHITDITTYLISKYMTTYP